MRYLLMICTDEKVEQAQSPQEEAAMIGEYAALRQELMKRGVMQDGERLRPTAEAKTVRVQDGKVLASDGPFAETKEQIGGFWMVDCKDIDEAIEIAAKIPGARRGAIEVREVWERPADYAQQLSKASA